MNDLPSFTSLYLNWTLKKKKTVLNFWVTSSDGRHIYEDTSSLPATPQKCLSIYFRHKIPKSQFSSLTCSSLLSCHFLKPYHMPALPFKGIVFVRLVFVSGFSFSFLFSVCALPSHPMLKPNYLSSMSPIGNFWEEVLQSGQMGLEWVITLQTQV